MASLSPTGCGKMMVILLGSLLMRKVNGSPNAVAIGTQPLTLLMEEKMANKVITRTRKSAKARQFYSIYSDQNRGSVLLVNLHQNIGLEKNQIVGDIACFPVQL